MGKRGQGTTVNAGGLSRTGQYSGGGPELSKGRHPAGVRHDSEMGLGAVRFQMLGVGIAF